MVQIFKGWTCDNKEVQRTTDCPNQDIIDKVNDPQSSKVWIAHAFITFWFQLTELMKLHKSKLGDDDHWRAFSYSKCMYLMHFHSPPCRAKASYPSNQGVEKLSSSYQKLCRGTLSQRCWGKDRSKGN